jgi:hypothetical protein
MSNGKDISAVDRWNHAVRVAHGDPASDVVDDVLAMTDEEIEADLRAGGVDLDAFDAEMDGLYEKYIDAAASAERAIEADAVAWTKEDKRAVPDEHPKVGRGRAAVAYTVLAAAAIGGIATYVATRPPPETPDVKPKDAEAPKAPKPAPEPSATPVVDVRKMRDDALAACAKGAYAECLAGLDAAKDADPAGDADPKVQAARKKADDALAAKGAKGK